MSNPRIARKPGQPAKSKKHSDLYTDEDPKGTIHGLKFASKSDAEASVRKIKSSGRSHAHKIQAAIAMEQRAKVMGKAGAAAVYRSFINTMKKKTKKMNEAVYKGNLGVMELVNFHSKATPAQKKKLNSHIKNKKHKEFRELIHHVTGAKLHKSVNEMKNSPLDTWDNEEPVKYTKHLTKTFGQPDELTDHRAVWYAKDGFQRIVVKDEYILHGSPSPHYDFVYCYVDIKVPHEFAEDMANSSESILIDFLKNEVGARCGSLTANAVTLNYVLDVVAKRVKPSKDEYEKRIKDMSKMFDSGKVYTVDWWPDESKDADPKNSYYKEGSVEEEYGAGEEGTDKVVKNYKKMTPGQLVKFKQYIKG